MPRFRTFCSTSWRSWDSCGCVSCCTLPGPADARQHRERQPSPSCCGVNAPRSPSRLQVSPTNPFVPPVHTTPRFLNHLPLGRPIRCPRPALHKKSGQRSDATVNKDFPVLFWQLFETKKSCFVHKKHRQGTLFVQSPLDPSTTSSGRHLEALLSACQLCLSRLAGLGEPPRQWPSQWWPLAPISLHRLRWILFGDPRHPVPWQTRIG